MSGMKYALAMVAAGGAVGVASQADAATAILNIGADDPSTFIFLAGATGPQYAYGHTGGFDFKTKHIPAKSAMFGQNANTLSGPFYTPGLPAAGEVINASGYNTVKDGVAANTTDFYLHLNFTDDLGAHYLGTANFDANSTLLSIDYAASDVSVAVPEPQTWALLIAGMGLAGAAMRRRRGQAAIA
jgi:hypothetical protein